jgi:hypothetical protein
MINKTIQETIDYLNSVANTNHKVENQTINALFQLMKEGYCFEDFKLVIDKKHSDWKGTIYEPYLRPKTLFGNKFIKYLYEQPRVTKNGLFKLASAVNKAKQFTWKLDNN